MRRIDQLKPAVEKPALLFLAGLSWVAVGIMLLSLAYDWLFHSSVAHALLFLAVGAAAALVIHHFGFLKVVDKNLARILPMKGKRCVFAFISWKSYLIIIVMVCTGIALRSSPIPKPFLAVLYIAIGLALVLSSVRYLRVLLYQLTGRAQ